MVQTQIELTEEQVKELEKIAAERGISMAELLRESVERTSVERTIEQRERNDQWRRALATMGRYRSGLKDVGRNHDKYFTRTFSSAQIAFRK